MTEDKKLKYRIAVRSESRNLIEATSAEEAITLWQTEMKLNHIPYRILEKQWIKGGFRLVIELQTQLNQRERKMLEENAYFEKVPTTGAVLSIKSFQFDESEPQKNSDAKH